MARREMIKEGARKLWTHHGISAASLLALFTGFIDGDAWAGLQGIISGGFYAGNVGEHISKKWK